MAAVCSTVHQRAAACSSQVLVGSSPSLTERAVSQKVLAHSNILKKGKRKGLPCGKFGCRLHEYFGRHACFCVCLLLFLLFCVFACVVFLIVFCTCFQHAWDDGRRRPGGARRASLGGALRELDKRFLGTPRPAASFAAEGCAEQSLLMLCW